jgi:hypothetical protein
LEFVDGWPGRPFGVVHQQKRIRAMSLGQCDCRALSRIHFSQVGVDHQIFQGKSII